MGARGVTSRGPAGAPLPGRVLRRTGIIPRGPASRDAPGAMPLRGDASGTARRDPDREDVGASVALDEAVRGIGPGVGGRRSIVRTMRSMGPRTR